MEGIEPVVFNDDSNRPSDGETLTVAGFGSIYEGGPGSFELRQVDVNYVSHTTCNSAYRGQIEEEIMFCAGAEGGGKDTCQGDSGGPILDSRGVLVGITRYIQSYDQFYRMFG